MENIVEKKTEITEETFFKNLSLDSLDLVEILFELEMEFNIQIPDDDWERAKSISDVIRLVHKIKIP